ncbi:MAG TPA: hypothetical protein VJT13_26640 [Xanthobacteraceae bacterium]|nr:hypothetical protein [Xanthobacteraceae bacterium]
MRSILTLAVAGLITAAALAPASAAPKHKRHLRTEAPAAQRIDPAEAIARPVYQTPNACWSDEGYGRFSSCDEGGY